MDKNKNVVESQSDKSNAGAPNAFQAMLTDKKWWVIGSVAAVVIIIAAVTGILLSQSNANKPRQSADANNQTKSQSPDMFAQQYGQSCQQRDVSFTSGPLSPSDLAYIRPLGAVSDGHVTPTDHVYVGPPNPAAADNTYAVLMPADGTVVQVDAMPAQYIGDRTGQQVAPDDHRIVISHSCRYFSIYIHVHKLSSALQNAAGSLQPGQNKTVSVALKAGDTVGYIGGSTFDWIPIDTTKSLTGFITPSLYASEPWKIHTVSPFDLYTGSLKTQLEAKSLRSTPPLGGKIDYDQPGKLIGNWFREGTGGYDGNNKDQGGRYWDGHLSIAPDYIDPTSTIVSLGNWTGSAAQFVVSGKNDPASVSAATGMVKYEIKRFSYVASDGSAWNGASLAKGVHPSQDGTIEGAIALQVMADERLKVEKFPGKTAAQVTGFTDAAQTYER